MAPLTTLLHTISTLSSRDTLSPLDLGIVLRARDDAKRSTPSSEFQPGTGTWNPRTINNKGVQALFALIGAAFVLASIWFFFWAKNGGFHFREGDWDDYKSTVLRRKGPNGTTLSGATKTTKLGGGSIVAGNGNGGDNAKQGQEQETEKEKAWKEEEQQRQRAKKKPRGNRNNEDADMRAYRHEKPAKVGGLNREADGIPHYYDGDDFTHPSAPPSIASFDTRSQASTNTNYIPINTPRATKPSRSKSPTKPHTTTPSHQKHPPLSDFYTPAPTSAASTTTTTSSSARPLRSHARAPAGAGTTHTPTHANARNKTRTTNSLSASYTEPLDFESRYTATTTNASASEAGTTGTKTYFHPLPGLGGRGKGKGEGKGGGSGGGKKGDGNGGFRRGRGRRDSLSESEGEGEGEEGRSEGMGVGEGSVWS